MLPLEGNTLTGLINLLRSPIQQNRTVHRLFCIATVTLVLASTTAVSAQSESERPDVPAVKPVAQQAPADPPAAPAISPATVRLQVPNSDVVDVLHLYEQLTGKKLVRSEEHTSELQSRFGISYAVFCLKKKKWREISCA